MLSNQQADATYQKARAALNTTIASFDTTDEQRRICQEKRENLTMDFIGQVLTSVEARTARFQEFINEMEALLAEFDPNTTIAGILQLKAVVDEAATLVVAVAPSTRASKAAVSARRVADATPARKAPASKRPARRSKKRPKQPAAPRSSRLGSTGRKTAAKAKPPARKGRVKKASVKRPAARKRSAKK